MCGIVGYIGKQEKKALLIAGLKELEYRGYDSAGLATLEKKCPVLEIYKTDGKINALESLTQDFTSKGEGVGIAHTRWATHGKPSATNAHPHVYAGSAIVHNGIIENYATLKEKLQKKGHVFSSQTDSEIIAHLFEAQLQAQHLHSAPTKEQALHAFQTTIAQLEGAYAILLINTHFPSCIFYAKERSPLLIALAKQGIFFASAPSALSQASQMVRLEDGAIGVLDLHTPFKLEDLGTPSAVIQDSAQSDLEGFKTLMQKEIYEQDKVLTLLGRIKAHQVHLELPKGFLEDLSCLSVVACGSSYHAGLVGKYLIEDLAQIKVQVELASEYRYAHPATQAKELVIAISQSGESADTLEALKLAKSLDLNTLAICNTQNSTMSALAHATLLTHAGLERSVASTKAVVSQILTLWLLALELGHKRLSKQAMQEQIQALHASMQAIKDALELHPQIKTLSAQILEQNPKGYFFMGRGVFYPLALEGALKLKELAYVHAQGYASAEMKHGPIALADCSLLSIALLPQNLLFSKNLSNVEELRARDGLIFAISPTPIDNATFQIQTKPYTHYMPEFFSMLVILQLFALEMAQLKGLDVDKPRNLAKSVTVE
ncbi:glutamine--fructose-6-phosphate transaminase (isomerizing) [Helicobacter bizzozeronii]|uniref:Glutamine--fructose-6-phosphate aminotransferase [isomerizing] n=1 Tax=Helicobacter bizzozeronii (strain CIII-1) TaxID=1002804 RepID=F8KTU3_HELBC|nr:glutamine--fructose-6-phosphate transaminase (isomerizing) [Helicobacter bizzozeronii]CCB80263.1 glucosamine--fructose-6-phosphate aminotransferase [isomerizing] [Helicobacter bizzozeronii CIII-1]